MPLFKVPKRPGRAQDSKIAQKSKTAKKAVPTMKSGNALLARISEIKMMVEKNLGKYADDYIIISEESELHSYINSCIDNGVISIDTETTGLDPLVDKIVGACLYTPEQKAAYVPINHISYKTGAKAPNQLTEAQLKSELQRCIDANIDIIMFNAKFDIRVLRNQTGLKDIYCTWDGYLAARLLNENEESSGLKALHKKYVLDGKGDAFSFDALFKGISFDKIPINTGYLYAAHDAIITYELYEYQKKYLRLDSPREDIKRLAWVFHNIEMPCVAVLSDMEDTGIAFDFDVHSKLYDKYHKLLEEQEAEVYKIIDMYKDDIQKYLAKNKNVELPEKVNLNSPKQVAVIIYDVLKLENPDKEKKRGTGSDVLSRIDHPLCKALVKYRELSKLITSFIDSLPTFVNSNDGRVHCSFKQYGADTGRMSCEKPNLQQIPSRNHEIRQMFRATEGYALLSSDYSAQEPRLTAQMCGDPGMIQAYKDGKDLYAEIASIAFNAEYEECLEFRPDGTHNPEGKQRRQNAKSILLGVTYGRGINSVAEQLNCSAKKAQIIQDKVFKGFPKLKEWEHNCKIHAEKYGWVSTFWGRKRRLPDLQLPEYEFRWKDGVPHDEDILDFDDMNEPEVEDNEVPDDIQKYYLKKLHKCWGSQKRAIFEEANKEGVWIVDNGAKIASAERQCANSIIQGSAADLTKLAMISIGNDKKLKKLGFRLLIPVHDELIGECPIENVEEVSKRFSQLMIDAAKDLDVPMKCDVEKTINWYGEELK